MDFTPFCVADRPISLRILRGMNLQGYSGNVGIMVHANTSENFQKLVAEYPLEGGVCPWHRQRHGETQCSRVASLRQRTIRMCDSGAFTKDGVPHSYETLFEIYERSGVEYGIIIDHLRQKDKTIASARQAMIEYARKPRNFQLVGVAQGRNPREYLDCYAQLKAMGYRHIAIGGLLNRRKNTARYVYVEGGRLFRILERLRAEYPRDWMFALGCYHPRRHSDMSRFDMFGSDYKGWIFNYEERNDLGIQGARRSRVGQVRRFLQRHVYADKRKPSPFRGRKPGKKTLAVVACSKRKIWDFGHQGGALAKDTYRGAFFQLARSYAEEHLDAWVVLSAKHGFLSPASRVPRPYDERLTGRLSFAKTTRLRQQVIQKGLHAYKRVVVLGGADYYNAVQAAFDPFGLPVVTPFASNHKIGTRLNLLKQPAVIAGLIAAAT